MKNQKSKIKNQKFIFKIIAVVLIQAFLVLDVAWCGDLFNDHRANQADTLAPSLIIDSNSIKNLFLSSQANQKIAGANPSFLNLQDNQNPKVRKELPKSKFIRDTRPYVQLGKKIFYSSLRFTFAPVVLIIVALFHQHEAAHILMHSLHHFEPDLKLFSRSFKVLFYELCGLRDEFVEELMLNELSSLDQELFNTVKVGFLKDWYKHFLKIPKRNLFALRKARKKKDIDTILERIKACNRKLTALKRSAVQDKKEILQYESMNALGFLFATLGDLDFSKDTDLQENIRRKKITKILEDTIEAFHLTVGISVMIVGRMKESDLITESRFREFMARMARKAKVPVMVGHLASLMVLKELINLGEYELAMDLFKRHEDSRNSEIIGKIIKMLDYLEGKTEGKLQRRVILIRRYFKERLDSNFEQIPYPTTERQLKKLLDQLGEKYPSTWYQDIKNSSAVEKAYDGDLRAFVRDIEHNLAYPRTIISVAYLTLMDYLDHPGVTNLGRHEWIVEDLKRRLPGIIARKIASSNPKDKVLTIWDLGSSCLEPVLLACLILEEFDRHPDWGAPNEKIKIVIKAVDIEGTVGAQIEDILKHGFPHQAEDVVLKERRSERTLKLVRRYIEFVHNDTNRKRIQQYDMIEFVRGSAADTEHILSQVTENADVVYLSYVLWQLTDRAKIRIIEGLKNLKQGALAYLRVHGDIEEFVRARVPDAIGVYASGTHMLYSPATHMLIKGKRRTSTQKGRWITALKRMQRRRLAVDALKISNLVEQAI